MTDVTVAPAGGAQTAAPNETVIETSPVTPPQPVGSQAPEKPPGEVAHPSRRDSIQKAFERANNPTAKTKEPTREQPKAAEAKAGHNNPPEKTEQVFDLKKRPQDQPRGDRGQFAPREQTGAQNSTQTPASGAQNSATGARDAQPRRLPSTVPFHEPPSRMAEHAKRDWATAPESVRGEFHRLAKEAGDMYRTYRPDHDKMNTIRHFDEMATQHGTTLDRALSNYVSMEQKLRSDVVGGLDVIVNNLNLRTQDGRKLNLRDIAYHVLNQSPEQHKLVQQSNAQQAASHQIGALHQEIAGLKSTLQEMHTQQQYGYTRSAVDQFADAHPRFDELGDLIQNEISLGFDLETAYRRAELLRPTTRAAQTRTPSAQTRPTDKSISGAPDVAPSNGASRPKAKVGRREAISNAMRTIGVA